jgi:hypothetical protein
MRLWPASAAASTTPAQHAVCTAMPDMLCCCYALLLCHSHHVSVLCHLSVAGVRCGCGQQALQHLQHQHSMLSALSCQTYCFLRVVLQVYREAVASKRCSAVHLTRVEAEPPCDTHFLDITAEGEQHVKPLSNVMWLPTTDQCAARPVLRCMLISAGVQVGGVS